MEQPLALQAMLDRLGLNSRLGMVSPSDPGPPPSSPATEARLEALDLTETHAQLLEQGFTVVKQVFTPDECAALAGAVKACVRQSTGKNMLSKGEPLFFSALTRDKLMALGEAFLGPDFLLMQYTATVHGLGGSGYQPEGVRCWAMHSDKPVRDLNSPQLLFTSPRHQHDLLTCCIVLSDGYSQDTGATHVLPGSHRLLRYPEPSAAALAEELCEPILAEQGDVACWDGNVWHAFGVRQIPGERIVLHLTYAHPQSADAMGDYDSIPAETFMGAPWEQGIVQLLQRDPATGAVLTPHPLRRRLYWEEFTYRLMDRLPAFLTGWLFRWYFRYFEEKERKLQAQQSEVPTADAEV